MRWFLAITACIWLAGGAAAQDAGGAPQLSVAGQGEVAVSPDMATISLGVATEAATAAEALAATSQATAAVLEQLAAAGIAAADIQTRDLTLHPVWEERSSSLSGGDGDRQITRYRAGNTVEVRVRVLDELGRILDDTVAAGANTFNGLSFGLKNPGPVEDEARRAAVSDAMRKARLYAQAAGLTLGPLVELREASLQGPEPFRMERMATMAEAVPVASGELKITAGVVAVFELVER